MMVVARWEKDSKKKAGIFSWTKIKVSLLLEKKMLSKQWNILLSLAT